MANDEGGCSNSIRMDLGVPEDIWTLVNRSADLFKEGMERSLMMILKTERAEMVRAWAMTKGGENISHAFADLFEVLSNPPDGDSAEEDGTARKKTMDAIDTMARRFKRHSETYREEMIAGTEKRKQEMGKIEEALCSMRDGISEVAKQLLDKAIEQETRDERKKAPEVLDRTEKLIESFKRHSRNYQDAAMALMEKSKQEKEWVEFAVDAMIDWLQKFR